MNINQNITTRNYTKASNRKIEYIVIHYVGAVSSAKNNTIYFKSTYRGASAHYFVDDNSVWQCVADKDIAWHCGGGLQGSGGHEYYKKCLNSNSIGIEMCCYKNDGKLDISEATVNNTIELTKDLMQKHNISADKVIMHYNVTGKNCPAPFISDMNRWNNFKEKLGGSYQPTQPTGNSLVKSWQIVMNKVYHCGLDVDGSYGPKSKEAANKHQLYKKKLVINRIRNDYVKWLQNRLNELGYHLAVDGSFWNDTNNAVKSFQKSRGLKVDGYVGASTVKELLK